jgi:hypothetical protein
MNSSGSLLNAAFEAIFGGGRLLVQPPNPIHTPAELPFEEPLR